MIVSAAVCKLNNIGLNIVSVICDQGARNQQMIKMFGVTAKKPWVNVGDSLVHFMYDPPHLLKYVRNNLMKHRFEVNGQIVDWKYISDFFERDSKQLVKLAPRLTLKHITLPCLLQCVPGLQPTL